MAEERGHDRVRAISRMRWHLAFLNLRLAFIEARLSLRAGFDPGQPRAPAGQPDGGRWVRVAQLDRPAVTVDLVEEEAAGGHTIARHVGRSDEWLMAQVRPVMTGLFVSPGVRRAGSFSSLRSADHWTNETLVRNFGTVTNVAKGKIPSAFVTSSYTARTGKEAFQPTRPAMWPFERPTGSAHIRPTFGVGVFIYHDPSSPRGFRVQTSYPRQD